MGNKLVRYNNTLHSLDFSLMTLKERGLFFSLCFFLKEKGTNEVTLSFNELREVVNFSKTDIESFIKLIRNTYRKLLKITLAEEDENQIEEITIFSKYKILKSEKMVVLKLNKDFEHILNKLENNYTEHELLEYTSLKSDYSQLTYAFFKKWNTTKKVKISILDFREKLGVPNSYDTSNFNRQVLKPIMEELPQYFPNLKLEKIKTGKKVTSLKFTWNGKVEKIEHFKNDNVIDIIEISDKLNKSIEKVKKNRFIEPLLTVDNIEILVEMFQEKDLIKGLNWSYKEIKQEIKSLNYLIKSIKTGMEKKEKKLVVKTISEVVQEEVLKENNVDLEKDQELKIVEIEKIIITKDKYEDLYQAYLKENNEKHNPYARKGFDIANKNKYEIVENKKQKIQEELVSSIYKIFMIENKLEESLESKKLFDEYLEKNYILTNDFESKEEWNNFLEFQDEVLNKEGYLTTKELNQDLTYDEYKQHLEIETEDDYNSLGEVLLSNESLKENFQEQKTPLNDETLLEEIKIREQFSELFENREDYTLAWMKNQIELEELKQILNKKKNRIEVKKLEDIETEKLLSKKGTPLKGGALIARLEKIAKDENIKIQYKEKIIGE